MKNKFGFKVAVWWLALCLIGGIFLIMQADKEDVVSETENRVLSGAPELTLSSFATGEWMEDIETFFTDKFPARDTVINATENILDAFNVLSADEKAAIETENMESGLENEAVSGAEQVSETDTVTATESADTQEITDTSGATVMDDSAAEVTDDDAEFADESEDEIEDGDLEQPMTDKASYIWLERVDGTKKLLYTYEVEYIQNYAETLRMMKGYLPEDGCIFFTMVPLSSIANRWVDQQQVYNGWGSTVETMLQNQFTDDEHIYTFNTWEILEPYMCGDTPMFYHVDHHWTAEGAYKVFCEMQKKRNMPIVDYEDYTFKSNLSKREYNGIREYFNFLYPLVPTQSTLVTAGVESKVLEIQNYVSRTYTGYMNNTRKVWRRIYTGADTGRKCLVICDSFGNCFTPYLLQYYDEVDMVDFRYGYFNKTAMGGSIGENITRYGIDDVYIVISTANGLKKQNSQIYLRQYLTE